MDNQAEENQGEWVTKKATPTDVFYHELGEELFKKNLPFLNDVLRQLLTVSMGLSGGNIFFLTEKNCNYWMQALASSMFLLAMLFAFTGVLPRTDFVVRANPEAVKKSFVGAVQWKYALVMGSSVFIFLGLAFATLGVLLKGQP